MITFEVTNKNGFLGDRRLTAGNTEKYLADFEVILDQGVVLASATATVTSPDSTVGTVALTDNRKSVTFFVTAALLSEVFTLALVITTTDGQTLNYTLVFNVGTPVVQNTALLPLPLIIGPTGSTGPAGQAANTGATGPTGTGLTGASGTFTTTDGKTVTVNNGRITSIV